MFFGLFPPSLDHSTGVLFVSFLLAWVLWFICRSSDCVYRLIDHVIKDAMPPIGKPYLRKIEAAVISSVQSSFFLFFLFFFEANTGERKKKKKSRSCYLIVV
jgi:hypothetical protein